MKTKHQSPTADELIRQWRDGEGAENPAGPMEISDEELQHVKDAIWGAINVGAPLYNQGNHEACFRIYEDASSRLERDSPCKGVRDARHSWRQVEDYIKTLTNAAFTHGICPDCAHRV